MTGDIYIEHRCEHTRCMEKSVAAKQQPDDEFVVFFRAGLIRTVDCVQFIKM